MLLCAHVSLLPHVEVDDLHPPNKITWLRIGSYAAVPAYRFAVGELYPLPAVQFGDWYEPFTEPGAGVR